MSHEVLLMCKNKCGNLRFTHSNNFKTRWYFCEICGYKSTDFYKKKAKEAKEAKEAKKE